MSKMILCTLYDRKANSYSPAVAYPDRVTAERAFVSLLAVGDSTPAQWPDDFALYAVGLFDPATGLVSPPLSSECLLTGQSAFEILLSLRKRQGRGGADGGNGLPCPPEDSGASAERSGVPSPDLPGLGSPSSPADNN